MRLRADLLLKLYRILNPCIWHVLFSQVAAIVHGRVLVPSDILDELKE